jgi:hypothetical protein
LSPHNAQLAESLFPFDLYTEIWSAISARLQDFYDFQSLEFRAKPGREIPPLLFCRNCNKLIIQYSTPVFYLLAIFCKNSTWKMWFWEDSFFMGKWSKFAKFRKEKKFQIARILQ